MPSKLNEINRILNNPRKIDVKLKVKEYKKKYSDELKDFKYINDINNITNKKYIKYIGQNELLNYGGFFYKIENKLIYLINSKKEIWTVDFDKNFIFTKDKITSDNDYKRNLFELFIRDNNIR